MSTVPPSTPPPGGTYTPPPPPPPIGGSAPSSDRTLMVVLSCLWILCLIPLLTKKDDNEVQWHAKNGRAILIGEIGVWVLFSVGGMVSRRILCAGCGVAVIEYITWI